MKYSDKTVLELREIAKEKGRKGYSKLNKEALIELIRSKPKNIKKGGANSNITVEFYIYVNNNKVNNALNNMTFKRFQIKIKYNFPENSTEIYNIVQNPTLEFINMLIKNFKDNSNTVKEYIVNKDITYTFLNNYGDSFKELLDYNNIIVGYDDILFVLKGKKISSELQKEQNLFNATYNPDYKMRLRNNGYYNDGILYQIPYYDFITKKEGFGQYTIKKNTIHINKNIMKEDSFELEISKNTKNKISTLIVNNNKGLVRNNSIVNNEGNTNTEECDSDDESNYCKRKISNKLPSNARNLYNRSSNNVYPNTRNLNSTINPLRK